MQLKVLERTKTNGIMPSARGVDTPFQRALRAVIEADQEAVREATGPVGEENHLADGILGLRRPNPPSVQIPKQPRIESGGTVVATSHALRHTRKPRIPFEKILELKSAGLSTTQISEQLYMDLGETISPSHISKILRRKGESTMGNKGKRQDDYKRGRRQGGYKLTREKLIEELLAGMSGAAIGSKYKMHPPYKRIRKLERELGIKVNWAKQHKADN